MDTSFAFGKEDTLYDYDSIFRGTLFYTFDSLGRHFLDEQEDRRYFKSPILLDQFRMISYRSNQI